MTPPSLILAAAAPQGNTLAAATGWLEGLVLGQVGTALAVLAVAGIGLAMLQGRLAARQGVRVILGCFILFGAPSIARGLLDLARWNTAPALIQVAPPPPSAALPSPPPPNPDPYAGASVPM